METRFEIKSDLEFYCYLKANLPDGYTIIAEPEKTYFNEWQYCYKLFYQNKLLDTYSGSYKDIETGYLVKKAKQLINKFSLQR